MFLEQCSLEFEIEIEKANFEFERAMNDYNFRSGILDIGQSYQYLFEEENGNSKGSLVEKIKAFIQKIINAITGFLGKLFKMNKKITDDGVIEALQEIQNDPELAGEIEMHDIKAEQEALNKYIQKMSQLERKLLAFRYDNKVHPGNIRDYEYTDEIMKMNREMDELNKEYEETVSKNKKLVKMALKDAIRFNTESLKNVKVDYSAVERGSTEILQQFKQDANGCDVPVKANMIQKMSNNIATKSRMNAQAITTYRHQNLEKILHDDKVKASMAKRQKFFGGIKNGVATIVKHPVLATAAVAAAGYGLSKTEWGKKHVTDPAKKVIKDKVVEPVKAKTKEAVKNSPVGKVASNVTNNPVGKVAKKVGGKFLDLELDGLKTIIKGVRSVTSSNSKQKKISKNKKRFRCVMKQPKSLILINRSKININCIYPTLFSFIALSSFFSCFLLFFFNFLKFKIIKYLLQKLSLLKNGRKGRYKNTPPPIK